MPVMVTEVAAPAGPQLGLTPVTVGAISKMNRSDVLVALRPAGVVTTTSTVPAVSAGETAVTWVAEVTV